MTLATETSKSRLARKTRSSEPVPAPIAEPTVSSVVREALSQADNDTDRALAILLDRIQNETDVLDLLITDRLATILRDLINHEHRAVRSQYFRAVAAATPRADARARALGVTPAEIQRRQGRVHNKQIEAATRFPLPGGRGKHIVDGLPSDLRDAIAVCENNVHGNLFNIRYMRAVLAQKPDEQRRIGASVSNTVLYRLYKGAMND